MSEWIKMSEYINPSLAKYNHFGNWSTKVKKVKVQALKRKCFILFINFVDAFFRNAPETRSIKSVFKPTKLLWYYKITAFLNTFIRKLAVGFSFELQKSINFRLFRCFSMKLEYVQISMNGCSWNLTTMKWFQKIVISILMPLIHFIEYFIYFYSLRKLKKLRFWFNFVQSFIQIHHKHFIQ